MSKDGHTRRKPFRVKLNKLNKLTTIKSATIKVGAYYYSYYCYYILLLLSVFCESLLAGAFRAPLPLCKPVLTFALAWTPPPRPLQVQEPRSVFAVSGCSPLIRVRSRSVLNRSRWAFAVAGPPAHRSDLLGAESTSKDLLASRPICHD